MPCTFECHLCSFVNFADVLFRATFAVVTQIANQKLFVTGDALFFSICFSVIQIIDHFESNKSRE